MGGSEKVETFFLSPLPSSFTASSACECDDGEEGLLLEEGLFRRGFGKCGLRERTDLPDDAIAVAEVEEKVLYSIGGG